MRAVRPCPKDAITLDIGCGGIGIAISCKFIFYPYRGIIADLIFGMYVLVADDAMMLKVVTAGE